MAALLYDLRKPLEDVIVTLNIGHECRIRLWIATQLMKFACRVLGATAKIEV